jgi:hypothetical protein
MSRDPSSCLEEIFVCLLSVDSVAECLIDEERSCSVCAGLFFASVHKPQLLRIAFLSTLLGTLRALLLGTLDALLNIF